MPDPLASSYDAGFARAREEHTEVYGELHGLLEAAHHRRMELLAGLDIGDLSDSVVVDYGVGPWGFAAVYPRLWSCRRAIGIDISDVALQMSREVTVNRDAAFGDDVEFLQSRGDSLPLDDDSVDLVFVGEALEHVEMPDVFLEEVFRVLRPSGQLVLTTPNSRPATYLATADEYGIGPEHIALMSYRRLLELLVRRFEVIAAHGYNTSLHHTFDDSLSDDLAARWARQFEHEPELASGVIVHARRLGGSPAGQRTVERRFAADATGFEWVGTWTPCHLHEQMVGMWSDSTDASICLDVPDHASSVGLLFWAHAWSGMASIETGGEVQVVDLFSSQGGFRRVDLTVDADEPVTVRITPLGTSSAASAASQVVFFAAFLA